MSTVAKKSESAVIVRDPEPRDYARMGELSGQLGYQSSAEEIARRIEEIRASPDTAVFLAELPNGEVAGWIGVFVYRCIEVDTRAEISGVIVDERFRSMGIGRRLLEKVEEWAREKGCGSVSVRCNVIRGRAHEFYLRSGFEHFKTQKCFRKSLT